jgi:hypothetical protein
MQKKRYSAPTLTMLGGATEKTRGRFGRTAELINYFFWLS